MKKGMKVKVQTKEGVGRKDRKIGVLKKKDEGTEEGK